MAPKVYFKSADSSTVYETRLSNEEREAIRKSAQKFSKTDEYSDYSDSYIPRKSAKPKVGEKQEPTFWGTVKKWFWGEKTQSPKPKTVKNIEREAEREAIRRNAVKKFIQEPENEDSI